MISHSTVIIHVARLSDGVIAAIIVVVVLVVFLVAIIIAVGCIALFVKQRKNKE